MGVRINDSHGPWVNVYGAALQKEKRRSPLSEPSPTCFSKVVMHNKTQVC